MMSPPFDEAFGELLLEGCWDRRKHSLRCVLGGTFGIAGMPACCTDYLHYGERIKRATTE